MNLEKLPKYISPKIISYTNAEILQKIGPVQAVVFCSGGPGLPTAS